MPASARAKETPVEALSLKERTRRRAYGLYTQSGSQSLSVEPAREGVGSYLPSENAGAIHIFSSHFGSGG